MSKCSRSVVIVGAGPAGLTAAFELLERDATVNIVIVERLGQVGGISRTEIHNGNRIDIGGHRFFSKSQWVMNWWRDKLPLVDGVADPVNFVPTGERFMLVRSRLSRIYYNRKYFNYPISLTADTLKKLGLVNLVLMGVSYLRSAMVKIRPEKNLEDFFVNRFGRRLYRTFFRDYTQKVWGVPCSQISPAWGAQRIKGLSVLATIRHAVMKNLGKRDAVKNTSLIEKFWYPKLGPGQLWEVVADDLCRRGVVIHYHCELSSIDVSGSEIVAIKVSQSNGEEFQLDCDYLVSSAPIVELVRALGDEVSCAAKEIAEGLAYRDFITVGLLVDRMQVDEQGQRCPKDNWIYIQEPDVVIGRLQIFNNWSPALCSHPDKVWLGLEYFCQEGDSLWCMSDEKLTALAQAELVKISLLSKTVVIEDATVIRVPKAYPAYFGSYDRFPTLRAELDSYRNLFLIGRNGMHRYNNQDHSMLSARLCAEAIMSGAENKEAIWSVNIDDDYHEEGNNHD